MISKLILAVCLATDLLWDPHDHAHALFQLSNEMINVRH